MKLLAAQTVALVGIGGTGMRGLAQMLAGRGVTILGTDVNLIKIQQDPFLQTFELFAEADAKKAIDQAEVVIYSDAVPPTNPLLQQAKALDRTVLLYSQAVGQLTTAYETIGVAGTHGKSSTSSMLAHILVEADRDPSALIGAPLPNWNHRNARLGKSDLFVLEADEFRDHFLDFSCRHAIITTLDFDHPDYFDSEIAVVRSFVSFISQLDSDGFLVMPNLVFNRLVNEVQLPAHTIAVPRPSQLITLSLPGEHMQWNAELAIVMAEQLGVPRAVALRGLMSFQGVGRRFELLGEINEMQIISDYGHHPTEIAATIKAAHSLSRSDQLAVVLEPHTVERLRQFMPDYVKALGAADLVVLAPVFVPVGREQQQQDAEILMQQLAMQLQQTGQVVEILNTYEELAEELATLSQKFTRCLCFTAGNLDAQLRHLVRTS